MFDPHEIHSLGNRVCLDMETALAPISFRGRKHVRLLQVYSELGSYWYDLQTFSDLDWEMLKEVLERPSFTWIGQNIAYDYRCLLGCGIRLNGRLEDTMKMSQLLNNGIAGLSHSLENIALRVLKLKVDKTLQSQDWMSCELDADSLRYAMGDVENTYKAWELLRVDIKNAGLQRVYDLECALIPAIVEMEHTGMLVDKQQAEAAITRLETEITKSLADFLDTLDQELEQIRGEGLPREPDGSYNLRPKAALKRDGGAPAGFNVNSTKQVLTYFEAIGIKPIDPKTGKVTTDKKILRPLSDQRVVFALLDYKRAEKRRSMISSWLKDHVQEDGRIRARFNPLSTGTGRFTSSSPNMQQIPRESYIRDIFIAKEGFDLVVVDVKNMEMAVACAEPIANEKLMQDALRDGVDLHKLTASKIFKVPVEEIEDKDDRRQKAKSCNFGLLFGSSALGLKEYFSSFGTYITEEEATEFRELWREAYPGMKAWHNWAKRKIQGGATEVRMVDGRRRFLSAEMARPTVLLNNIVQGTSASIVKATMVNTWPRLPEQARLVAQVHDELIVETPEGTGEEVLSLIKRQLHMAGRNIIGDSVAMVGDGSVAKTWGKAK